MRSPIVVSFAVASLLAVGTMGIGNSQVDASSYTLKNNTYIYNSKLKRTVHVLSNKNGKKVFVPKYFKGNTINVLGSRRLKGKLYYRIGNNEYVKATSVNKTAKQKSVNKNTQTNYGENAAGFMHWLSTNKDLNSAQKNGARTAAQTLMGHGNVPSWFNKYVKLGQSGDATSKESLAQTLPLYNRLNKIRRGYNVKSAKVSLPMIAYAMINADYQKQGGLQHAHYYKVTENLAAGTDPLKVWMNEKPLWVKYAKKHPGEKATNTSMTAWNNSQAGHYLNLIDHNSTGVGFGYLKGGNMGNVTAFDAQKANASAISASKFIKLANKWIAQH